MLVNGRPDGRPHSGRVMWRHRLPLVLIPPIPHRCFFRPDFFRNRLFSTQSCSVGNPRRRRAHHAGAAARRRWGREALPRSGAMARRGGEGRHGPIRRSSSLGSRPRRQILRSGANLAGGEAPSSPAAGAPRASTPPKCRHEFRISPPGGSPLARGGRPTAACPWGASTARRCARTGCWWWSRRPWWRSRIWRHSTGGFSHHILVSTAGQGSSR
jgi:hypothetical protein